MEWDVTWFLIWGNKQTRLRFLLWTAFNKFFASLETTRYFLYPINPFAREMAGIVNKVYSSSHRIDIIWLKHQNNRSKLSNNYHNVIHKNQKCTWMRKWDRKIKRITYWLTPYLMKFVYQLVWKWVKIRLSTLFVSTNYFYFKPKVSMLNSSLTFDWLGHVIVKNKWNIPGKEMKWRNQLWEILLALFYTHSVKKKKTS